MDTVGYKLGQLQVGSPMVVAIVVAQESVIAVSIDDGDFSAGSETDERHAKTMR